MNKNTSELKLREAISNEYLNIGLDIGGSLCKIAIVVKHEIYDSFKKLINEKYDDKYLDYFLSNIFLIKKKRKLIPKFS